MFGLKGRDTFNKPTSDVGVTVKKVGQWWIKSFPNILWIIGFCVIAIIVYTWYLYLYKKDVTEKEKQAYIAKQMSEVTFKKKKFDTLKDIIIKRQENFDKQRVKYKDVFYEREFLQNELEKEI